MEKSLSIKEIATQIHQEFPTESAFLIEFISATIHAVNTNHNYLKDHWVRSERLFDFPVWIGFMNTIGDRITRNKNELIENPEIFGKLLFGDSNMMFTLHCLYSLINAIPENQQFINRVKDIFY